MEKFQFPVNKFSFEKFFKSKHYFSPNKKKTGYTKKSFSLQFKEVKSDDRSQIIFFLPSSNLQRTGPCQDGLKIDKK